MERRFLMVIYWENLPMNAEANRVSVLKDIDYQNALKKDLTENKFLPRQFQIISKTHQNFILSAFGRKGSGKSRVMLFLIGVLSGFIRIDFGIENIHFTLRDMLKDIENAKEGSTHFLDEQVNTSGYGSQIEKMALENLEMTIRKRRINLFFSCPAFVRHNFDFYLETWEMGALKPWNWDIPIHEQWKFSKSIVYDEKDHKIGFIVTGDNPNKELLKAYEQKKDVFLDMIQQRRSSGRFNFYDEKARNFIKNNDFMNMYVRAKNKTLKKLLITEELRGELFSTEEIKLVSEKIDYLINFDSDIRADVIRTIKSKINH